MKILRRFRALFGRQKLDAEMTEELRTHLDLQTERHIAAGMNPDEARYLAMRQFGNVASIQERAREGRGWVWLENLARDVRFAFRTLRRSVGFSLAVLATLALCIGPNVAILSALYALVYKPLPFAHPEQLVSIANVAERAGGAKRQSSVVQYADFKAHASCFESFGYYNSISATLGTDDQPARVAGMRVSADLLSTLGIQPRLGRFFREDEQTAGNDHVVVLTSTAWENRYNGDPTVIGRTIRLDSENYVVVGVAPARIEEIFTDLFFLSPYPIDPAEQNLQSRYASSVRLAGRLKTNTTIEAARTQLQTLEQGFYAGVASPPIRTFLETGGYRIAVTDAHQDLAEPVRAPLFLLQLGAALVLLIGCVNVASLLLARVTARRPELSVRHALGAGWGALLRQMLTESFLLVGLASAAGVGLAFGLLRCMNHYLPAVVRHLPPVELNAQVLGMVSGVVVVMVLAMGLVPFLMLWRSGLRVGGTPQASAGKKGRSVIDALVIGQMGIALILLVSAGLLIHSFARVVAVDPGFDAARIVQGRISLPAGKYRNAQDNVAVRQRMLVAMKGIPGVESASLTAEFGVAASFQTYSFLVHGGAVAAGNTQSLVYLNSVSADFFETMGIRLHGGRIFRDDDDVRKNPVAIVDQVFAERYFPGQDVVGRELVLGATPPAEGQPWIRIVGVVARANLTGLEGRDGWPFLYLPFNQQRSRGFSLLVRSPRPESDIVSEMRERIRTIDPELPVHSSTLAKGIDALLGTRRALVFLLGLFAGLALILAAVGLYGVLNYDVSQRTREIGIRGAIGANRRQIVQMILREGLWKAGIGLALGLTGALLLTRSLRKLLFDVTPVDPLSFIGVSLLLLLVSVVASWLPARRAARVDPLIALKAE